MPAPTPAPAETPEVSTPLAPVDKFALPATVSLILNPDPAPFPPSTFFPDFVPSASRYQFIKFCVDHIAHSSDWTPLEIFFIPVF